MVGDKEGVLLTERDMELSSDWDLGVPVIDFDSLGVRLGDR